MWYLEERNTKSFDECERTMIELKAFFTKTLLEWMSASGMFSFASLVDLVDFCSFRALP